MQESNQIILFDFEEKEVRVIKDELGDPWFVAKDFCEFLGFDTTNVKQVLDTHVEEDEKGRYSVPTLGGLQQIWCVNESGLYALIFRSNKPKAKEFRRFITSEVIPSIRKTGSYSFSDKTMENDIDYTKRARAFKAVVSVCEIVFDDKNQRLLAANNMVKRNLSFDWLAEIGASKLIAPVQERYLTVTELAKQLNTTAVKLNKELEKAGFQEASRDHKNRLVWNPTDEGKKHSVLTDTGKQHSSGKPVVQLHWYASILEQLKQLSVNH